MTPGRHTGAGTAAACHQRSIVVLFLLSFWWTGVAAQPHLHVTALHDGAPTPVRVHLASIQGPVAPLPEQAVGVMYGMWDHADGYAFQPDSSFYVDGIFDVGLAPGTYVLKLSKGNEFVAVTDTIDVEDDVRRTYILERWIDTAAMGWYSADGHIHVRRSPREDPLLMTWISAEDVRIGNMLRMGDFWATYYAQYAYGNAGVYQKGSRMLVSGQEDPRTPELGHVVGLGIQRPVRFRDQYYLYDLVLDSIRAEGGAAGYAHQAQSFHGYRGLTLDGLREKVDLVELIQYCVPGGPLITEQFYFLLNLGFPVTAVAGSDFPWCGKPHDGSHEIPFEPNARIGNARFYTLVDGSLTYTSWMEGIRNGRTVASSGPFVAFEVNGKPPGSHVALQKGDSLRIRAVAYGHPSLMPLEGLELVVHGEVLAVAASNDAGQSSARIELPLTIRPEHGMWIAARTTGPSMHVAHTTPVYVSVAGDGFHRRTDTGGLLDRAESYLQELESELDPPPHEAGDGEQHDAAQQAWRYRRGLMERIEATRAVIEELRARL